MRKMRNLFVSLFICVSLITFSCKKESTTTTTLEGKKVSNAKVIMVEGNAFVLDQTTNQWEQLVAGDLLKESDTIKTESKSNVEIQFQEGSIIKIKENSELKIAKLYSEQNINNTKLFLNSGTLLAKPEKQTEGSSFEVDTKSITAGVRGTEFIVVAGSNVTKVAVNSGKVIIKKRLILDSLDRVKEIDLNIAKKIEDVAIGEIELAQNEKIVVSDDDIKNLNSKVEQDISSIVSELEKNKDSEEKLKETIATIEKEKINDINSFSSKVIKKDKITDKDKKTDIPVEEFKDMGKNNISENTTTTTTIIEEKKISKDKEKVTEETTTNIEKQLVTVVDKLGNLGLTFSEKNTGVTTNNKFIYIATDTNKSLLCLNTSGKLLWKFSNPKLKKIESFITPYKNMVVFGSYDSIFVLNANSGEIIQSLDITNGTSFWAKPVEIANSIIIPTSRYTYKFDGSSISVMNEIEVSQGQVYMAAKNNSLYISDSLYQNIKEFDISSNSVTWTSNNLLSSSYMLPVISDQYLVIADNDGNLYRFNIKQKTKSYNILKIGSGVTSNIVSDGLNLYFVAKDGFFYKADLNTFNSVQKVIKVDNNPGSDKYLTKKLVMANDKIYFASDSGKIFSYDKTKNEAIFINIEENKENLPLVGSPVVINNEVYVIDTKSNIYKAYETYK
ncbi:MAG TPA: FecR domain-containing protein [Spirochaetota bacterium]|nr:FecR domain-containing protein [Spirochaetota bacterium]HOL56704.1 FecR domain-containing protein [Spirochaetota bacterium]